MSTLTFFQSLEQLDLRNRNQHQSDQFTSTNLLYRETDKKERFGSNRQLACKLLKTQSRSKYKVSSILTLIFTKFS